MKNPVYGNVPEFFFSRAQKGALGPDSPYMECFALQHCNRGTTDQVLNDFPLRITGGQVKDDRRAGGTAGKINGLP